MPSRLSLASLSSLPPGVQRPAYDPTGIAVGIVHLGLGAFHRAHQAVFTDAILGRDPRWGICGVSLKTPRATAVLAAQDGLYTVLTKGLEGTSARVIGALRETMFAGADRGALVARLADPRVTVVTLTVTEKGYCHDPASGKLNFEHADIAHDLADPGAPVSAVGLLVAALARRRDAAAGSLNVICCDNLPQNGRVLEGLVQAFAQRRDPSLAAWIERHAAFPCTMVDRIVPATTPADIAETAKLLGVDDAAPVMTEPYNSWVIEDRFVAARPAWEDAGANVVSDVAPFETMKLRMLNGSHSTMAYLGFLMGHEFIWQASSDPLLAEHVQRQMAEEIAPTLRPPPGADPAHYAAELMTRFRNPALPHRTQQIAMDGSQKLPQRLLNTVRDRMNGGGSYAHLALAVAGWIRYASGTDEHGRAIEVSDPMAPTFAGIAFAAVGDAGRIADGFLDLVPVFGADLAASEPFRAAVRGNVVRLFRDGARATLAAHLGRA
jgi:fructuronate reductase